MLGISEQDSVDRFIISWNAMPHDGKEFRRLISATHELLRPFFDDSAGEIYTAHQMHQYLHMLRWMSYPMTPLPIELAEGKTDVTLLDYGCGMALTSIATAIDWGRQGITVHLTLADLDTVMTEFLHYACAKLDISHRMVQLPCTFTPACQIAIVTEVWEHLYDFVGALEAIDNALAPGGLLVTDITDRHKEMFHVSPDLSALRERFAQMNYAQVEQKVWRKNA